MKVYGQLEFASLEQADVTDVDLDAIAARVIADNSLGFFRPFFHDGSNWTPLRTRRAKYRAITGVTSLNVGDETVLADATSAGFTATLPDPTTMTYQSIYVKKTDATFNAVTLATAGGNIEGSATRLLATKGEWVLCFSDGTNWKIVQWGYYEGKTAYTPTGSWVANTTYTGYWWRTGNRLNIDVKVTCSGAPTSADLTVNTPSGPTIDTAQMLAVQVGKTPLGGRGMAVDAGLDVYTLFPCYSSTTSVYVMKDDGDGTQSPVTQAAPFTFGSADAVQLQVINLPMTNWAG